MTRVLGRVHARRSDGDVEALADAITAAARGEEPVLVEVVVDRDDPYVIEARATPLRAPGAPAAD